MGAGAIVLSTIQQNKGKSFNFFVLSLSLSLYPKFLFPLKLSPKNLLFHFVALENNLYLKIFL